MKSENKQVSHAYIATICRCPYCRQKMETEVLNGGVERCPNCRRPFVVYIENEKPR